MGRCAEKTRFGLTGPGPRGHDRSIVEVGKGPGKRSMVLRPYTRPP